jgi:hypothetical protein
MRKLFYNLLFKFALKVLANNIVHYGTKLTPDYLEKRGFVKEGPESDAFWFEESVKERDRICIAFRSDDCYTVMHSGRMTFIAIEVTVEWFEAYYMLMHPDNGRYNLAPIR